MSRVLKKADEMNISWPLDETMTDDALENILFPKEKSVTNKRMPDYAYIRKELLRNGVSKKLLWSEYCEDCLMVGEEPLMCIHSSAITSNRMSRKDELPCTFLENLVNRLK